MQSGHHACGGPRLLGSSKLPLAWQPPSCPCDLSKCDRDGKQTSPVAGLVGLVDERVGSSIVDPRGVGCRIVNCEDMPRHRSLNDHFESTGRSCACSRHLRRVVEDDSKGVPSSRTQLAHAMSHARAVGAAHGRNWSGVNRNDDCLPLPERHNVHQALLLGRSLSEQQLATSEVRTRL